MHHPCCACVLDAVGGHAQGRARPLSTCGWATCRTGGTSPNSGAPATLWPRLPALPGWSAPPAGCSSRPSLTCAPGVLGSEVRSTCRLLRKVPDAWTWQAARAWGVGLQGAGPALEEALPQDARPADRGQDAVQLVSGADGRGLHAVWVVSRGPGVVELAVLCAWASLADSEASAVCSRYCSAFQCPHGLSSWAP